MAEIDRLDELKRKLIAFRDERDWQQFHDPKNLAEAISVEAGELLENFLWKTRDQATTLSEENMAAVRSEIADVFTYLLYIGDALGVDLVAEATTKLTLNEKRYPVERAKGNARKYHDL